MLVAFPLEGLPARMADRGSHTGALLTARYEMDEADEKRLQWRIEQTYNGVCIILVLLIVLMVKVFYF